MTEFFEHGYAVLIGVDENNIDDLALPTVAKDVGALAEVLVHPERCAYDPDNVRLVKGKEATHKNILRALVWLGGKVEADPEATAVIYYSGHGMVDKESGQYYLIPYDIDSLEYLQSDAIEADKMSNSISAIQAERTLVILDCCHAAGMRVKDVDIEALSRGKKVQSQAFPLDQAQTKDIPEYEDAPQSKSANVLLGSSGRAVLNSSTGSQSSYVRLDGQMSLFTYHLIEALNGHAPHPDDAKEVLVTEVMTWVKREVEKSADKIGVEQTPIMRTNGVFPVAKLIGGQGVAKAKGQIPPHPLNDRPQTDAAVITFIQTGQKIGGSQYNIGGDATFGQIGDTINVEDGDFVRGDKNVVQHEEIHGPKIEGDLIEGDKVAGDKIDGDKISVGSITGGAVAMGRGSQATVHSDAQRKAQGLLERARKRARPEQPQEEMELQLPAGKKVEMEAKTPEVDETEQARRFQVATPEIARIGQAHELMAMVALAQGPGLRALLPKTTTGGDIIDDEDVQSQQSMIKFPSDTEPVTLFIEVQASKRDFEIDDPLREIMVYPDSDSMDEVFYLEPLRATPRAIVRVRLLRSDKRRLLGYVPVIVKIEPPADPQSTQAGAIEHSLEEIKRLFGQSAINVNYNVTNVGSINSSATSIGPDSSAQTQ